MVTVKVFDVRFRCFSKNYNAVEVGEGKLPPSITENEAHGEM